MSAKHDEFGIESSTVNQADSAAYCSKTSLRVEEAGATADKYAAELIPPCNFPFLGEIAGLSAFSSQILAHRLLFFAGRAQANRQPEDAIQQRRETNHSTRLIQINNKSTAPLA